MRVAMYGVGSALTSSPLFITLSQSKNHSNQYTNRPRTIRASGDGLVVSAMAGTNILFAWYLEQSVMYVHADLQCGRG